MMLKKISPNLIALLIVTIAFGGIVHFYSKDEKQKLVAAKNIDRPDFFMNNIQSRSMDKSGKLRYILTAEKVEHQPKEQNSFITKPEIHTYKQNINTWKILADNGEVPDGNSKAILKENVIANQNTSNVKHPISVKSNQLIYDIDEEKMITKGKVIITTPSSIIQGKKMIADIKTDTLEIFTNVNARHEPQSSSNLSKNSHLKKSSHLKKNKSD